QPLPWELLGVPLALLSSETSGTETTLFLDRGSVVRSGGTALARPRPAAQVAQEVSGVLQSPDGAGIAPLWRARVEQFAEHLSSLNSTDATALASHFSWLPPAGLLPRFVLDFLTTDQANASGQADRAATSYFFPTNFAIEAVPIPTEQLDAELASSAALTP